MRKSEIIDQLKKYDDNKSIIISIVGDHPSIVALREFYNSLREDKETKEYRELTPLEHLQLGIILLDKKPEGDRLSQEIYSYLSVRYGEDHISVIKILRDHGLVKPGRDPVTEEILLAILKYEDYFRIKDLNALIPAAKAIYRSALSNKTEILNKLIVMYDDCLKYSVNHDICMDDFESLFNLITSLQIANGLNDNNLNKLFSYCRNPRERNPESSAAYLPEFPRTGSLLEGLKKLKESKVDGCVDLLFKDPGNAEKIVDALCCLSRNKVLDDVVKTIMFQLPDEALFYTAYTLHRLLDNYTSEDKQTISDAYLNMRMFTQKNVRLICKLFETLQNPCDTLDFFVGLANSFLLYNQGNLDNIFKSACYLDPYISYLTKIIEIWTDRKGGMFGGGEKSPAERMSIWQKHVENNVKDLELQIIFDNLVKIIVDDSLKESKDSSQSNRQSSLHQQLRGIVETFYELDRTGNLSIDTFQLIFNNRQYAEGIAAVLKKVNNCQLYSFENYVSICHCGIYDLHIADIFAQLNTHLLLNQENFNAVMLKPQNAELVESSLEKINRSTKLRQGTFDLIWQNPEHHQDIADAVVLLELSSLRLMSIDFLNVSVLKAISENPSEAANIARNIILAVEILVAAKLNSKKENVNAIFEFAGFCRLGSDLQALQEQKNINQNTFDESIRMLRRKQMEALCMGMHDSLGAKSALRFLGKRYANAIGDRNVLPLIMDCLNPRVASAGVQEAKSDSEDKDDDAELNASPRAAL